MKKRFAVSILAVIMAISCVLGLAACNGGIDGTYYAYSNGVKQDDGAITLKDGTLTVSSTYEGTDVAMTGTYTVDGDIVSITMTFMGMSVTQKLTKVSDGVLKQEENGSVTYFCKDGKTPPTEEKDDTENT